MHENYWQCHVLISTQITLILPLPFFATKRISVTFIFHLKNDAEISNNVSEVIKWDSNRGSKFLALYFIVKASKIQHHTKAPTANPHQVGLPMSTYIVNLGFENISNSSTASPNSVTSQLSPQWTQSILDLPINIHFNIEYGLWKALRSPL